MRQGIMFVGIDVDDDSFHGCGINRETGEVRRFVCRPNVGDLVKKLSSYKGESVELRVCYEATYLGFSLKRDLEKAGYVCDVIAPSSIPKRDGERVKTDRLDSERMAEYYSLGQLTVVHTPSEEEEMTRDLIRSRGFMSRQMRALKLHVLSECRRVGLNYREAEGGGKAYWTQRHREWLLTRVKGRGNETLSFNVTMLLKQLEEIEGRMELYDERIKQISEREGYHEGVEALCSYRGISVLTAMTLITELGDIQRFKHPKQLCSYAGMELREYSSGGHERRYGMSKMGNGHLRRSVIEACQLASEVPRVSKPLRARREGVKGEYIEIADRCMRRLYKKSRRLLHRGKVANKVKVACARELLCFVWESLNAARGSRGEASFKS